MMHSSYHLGDGRKNVRSSMLSSTTEFVWANLSFMRPPISIIKYIFLSYIDFIMKIIFDLLSCVYMLLSENNFQESVFSFHCVDPQDRTQVTRLWDLYPMSHLACTITHFKTRVTFFKNSHVVV